MKPASAHSGSSSSPPSKRESPDSAQPKVRAMFRERCFRCSASGLRPPQRGLRIAGAHSIPRSGGAGSSDQLVSHTQAGGSSCLSALS